MAFGKFGHNEGKRNHTKNEFGLTFAVKWDRNADRTRAYVKFSAPLVFRNPNNVAWEKYVADCHRSLHRVAAEQSVEILVWPIDLDWDDELTLISHHVYARGLLPGVTPAAQPTHAPLAKPGAVLYRRAKTQEFRFHPHVVLSHLRNRHIDPLCVRKATPSGRLAQGSHIESRFAPTQTRIPSTRLGDLTSPHKEAVMWCG